MNSRRNFVSLAGALALAGFASVNAGVNSWTFTGPGGGEVSAVAIQPDNSSVLLASSGNGVYRSTDAGATWSWVGEGANASSITYDPSAPERVFVVDGGGRMYRSGDAGGSFARVTTLLQSPHRLAISASGTVYVADRQGGVHRSTDAGGSWTELPHPWAAGDERVTAIAVHPAPAPLGSQIVYVSVAGTGTYRSVDGGQTWAPPSGPSPGEDSYGRVYDIVFKPDDPDRVLAGTVHALYVSDDAGASWSAPHTGTWLALAFDSDPAAPNKVIALVLGGHVRRSLDGGDTWPVAQNGPSLSGVQSFDLALAGSRAIAGTLEGPAVSGDAGDTFALRISGIHAQSVGSFSTTDSGLLFASFHSGPFGVFRREGVDWHPVGNEALRSNLTRYPMLYQLAASPSTDNRLFVVGDDDILLQSLDGGASWLPSVAQFHGSNIILDRIVMDPADASVVYLTTGTAGVWKSVDHGSSFVQRSTGLPGRVHAIVIDPANPQVLYAGGYFSADNGVFKSIDAGDTWTQVGAATLPPNPVLELYIDPEDTERIYAILQMPGGGSSGLFVSTNGGAAWTEISLGDPPAAFGVIKLHIDPALPTTLIAVAVPSPNGGGFVRSVDRGATWQRVDFTPIHPNTGSFDNMAVDRGFGMVLGGGYGTGLHEYQISTDLSVDLVDLPGPLALDSTGTIGIPVTNHGPFDAAAPDLHVNLPTNLTVAVPDGCQFTAPALRCELPAIPNGQTYTLTLNYIASGQPQDGTLDATVLAREYDPVSANHQRFIAVSVAQFSDLQVTSTATAAVQTNSVVSYTATARNNGPNATTATTFRLTIPAGITVQGSTPSTGTCSTSGSTMTCELGALTSGVSATVSVQGTATAPGTITWSGSISGSGTDGVSTNNTSSSVTSVTAPPAPPSNGGGKGGGGSLDWLALGLLGLMLGWRARVRGIRVAGAR